MQDDATDDSSDSEDDFQNVGKRQKKIASGGRGKGAGNRGGSARGGASEQKEAFKNSSWQLTQTKQPARKSSSGS